ncbi:MAG: CTP synthase (glutamine hydrolyzing) [Candidatus Aenigmarchaeota archaeon]|nr:CTP synthase (glutamine hydrolyzing) [Candidatus Aenigmarchaeota archaeon]
MPQTKYVVVTGGVLSGLGKGCATAALGRLLKCDGKLLTVKCDGYLNVDPGTMNPVEHGEVFVLHDGGEVDMDFGHYERFLDVECKSRWNLTSGKIFNSVISKERKGEYLGKTIQIFPHVSNEIKDWIFSVVKDEQPDIVLIEIGGTVGDIENSWFVESARQLKRIVGAENMAYIHLTYVPFLHSVGEPKTKVAQRDVALLREKGITPDIIICRSKDALPAKVKEKLALFCDIEPTHIITSMDIDTIYEMPLVFLKQGMLDIINQRLGLQGKPDMSAWEVLVQKIKQPTKEVSIAICGKYTELKDSYASLIEALVHAGAHLGAKITLRWIETTDIETGKICVGETLKGVQGVLVPGGFGSRGVEGKILLIKHARENKIPFLGICYGLQLAVVEFAQNVCGLAGAHSTEVVPQTQHPVIDLLPEQQQVSAKGGTMRLGACKAVLEEGSLVAQLYGASTAVERHRHRYEVNPAYHEKLRARGMRLSGMSENRLLVEFIELSDHPFFVATQAHNELTSRLEKPNPLFYGFVRAALVHV